MYSIIQPCFIYALLIFSNSLRGNTIEWNMLQLQKIVCKKYNFNIRAFVGFIVWIVY
jgi:hypothetical protein